MRIGTDYDNCGDGDSNGDGDCDGDDDEEHLDRILPVQQGLWQPVDICGRRQPGGGGP